MKCANIFFMEKVRKCPSCDTKGLSMGEVINFDDRIGIHSIFVDKCNECEMYYQSPLFSTKIRDEIYRKNFIGNNEKQADYVKLMNKRRNGFGTFFSSFVEEGKSVAEIGCSSGFILNEMHENVAGEYFGFDIDESAIEFGKHHFKNINLSCQDFFSFNGSFDVIVLSHILEHIDEPISFLKRVSKKVNANGKIIISVPNSNKMFEKPF